MLPDPLKKPPSIVDVSSAWKVCEWLGDTAICILNPGIRIFPESHQNPRGNSWFSKRTMVEKNGQGIKSTPGISSSCARSSHMKQGIGAGIRQVARVPVCHWHGQLSGWRLKACQTRQGLMRISDRWKWCGRVRCKRWPAKASNWRRRSKSETPIFHWFSKPCALIRGFSPKSTGYPLNTS